MHEAVLQDKNVYWENALQEMINIKFMKNLWNMRLV